MNKVTVRLVGGLGNQLHCYAFGVAFSRKHNIELEVDYFSNFWNQMYGKVYLLDNFRAAEITKAVEPVSEFGKLIFRLKLKFAKSVLPILPLSWRPLIDEGVPSGFERAIFEARYFFNPYFMGYWCSYRYYDDIERELRSLLSPPVPNQRNVLNVLSTIKGSSSCFIHYRAYLEEKGPARVSMSNYYLKAIDLMRFRFPDITFYVFSDDHASAREQLSGVSADLCFVELQESIGDLASLNDFYLMYSCDHSIIGDSTFSWWAAWLGDQAGKKVIAPKGLSPWGEDWLPDNWVGIDAIG